MSISTHWIKPFELKTENPWNQTISGNGVTETAFKVVKAVLMTILETLQNIFFTIANASIAIANKAHDCFAGRKIEPLPPPIITAPPPPPLELEVAGLEKINRIMVRNQPRLQLFFQNNEKADQFFVLFMNDQCLLRHPEDGKKVVAHIETSGRLPAKMVQISGTVPEANHDILLDWLKAAINKKQLP